MAVQQLLGLEEGNETEVQHPDMEKTAHMLQDRRSVRSVALTGLFLLASLHAFPGAGIFIPMLAIVFNFLLVHLSVS